MEVINSVEHLRFLQAEVTELRQRLNQAEAREQKNLALLERAGALVVKFDRQFRYVYINSNIKTISGLSPLDYLYKTNAELGIAEGRIEFWQARLEQVFQSGEEVTFNFEYNGPRGLHCYQACFSPEFDTLGRVETVMGITTDVSTRQEDPISYRDLADKLPLIVWVARLESGSFYINHWWTEYSGLEVGDSLMGGWEVALHPEDAGSARVQLQKCMQQDEAFELLYRLRRKDGIYRWHLIRGLPVFSTADKEKGEKPNYWVGICTDIDDLKQAEANQQELSSSKDLFVSMAAHELRAPLTSIQGFAQLLQRNLSKQQQDYTTAESLSKEILLQHSERNHRSIDNILHQTKQMNNLISQMLDLSRLENRKLDLNLTPDANLAELVERVVEQRRVTINSHSVQFKKTEDGLEDVLRGVFDADRVEQVLNNLLSNAIKYSSPGTLVEVGLKRCEELATPTAVIWVRDQGIGIKPEDQPHIFDRYYRVRSPKATKVEGLGLGLYICAEIVNLHNGRLWLESAVGQGSTFYVALPLSR